MIVTCESCKTKFRLDPALLKGPRTKVRCTRCKSVFQVTRPEEEDKIVFNLNAEEDVYIEEDQPGFSTTPSRSSVSPRPQANARLRPVVLVLCTLVAVAGVYILAQKFLFSKSGTPVDEVTAKAEQPAITISSTTQAYFLENSHVGQIFVVQGEVVNEGPKPVSFVLLEGKLYTTNNQIAQTQKSFCGNAMTRDELGSLGIVEIQNRMMNREGKDMSNVHMAPKSRLPFMVVFHNLPEFDRLSDYSVEVISSQVD